MGAKRRRISGSTGFTLEAEDAKKDEPTIKAQLMWDGVKGNITVTLGGFIDFDKEVVFHDGYKWDPMYQQLVRVQTENQ